MVISISKQFELVICSLVAGIITGMLFDSYRLLRGSNNGNKIITFVEDTLFWVFAAILIFLFLLYANCAYIGMYVYVWIAVGIYLYMKIASKFFINSQYKVFKITAKSLRIIRNIVLYPFQFIIYSIKRKNRGNYKK